MKKIILILAISLILISSGCAIRVDTRSDYERAADKAIAESINEADKILQKEAMLSNVKSTPSCSKSTNSCTLTWEDTNTKKIVKSARLEVWKNAFPNDELLFSETVFNSSGTVSYNITEDTLGNTYEARGFFETEEWFDNEYD